MHESLIASRLDRQTVLDRLVSPDYVAILDEAVLRRGFGGDDVMAGQIRWLIERANMPHIGIHVIPFRHGGYHNPGYFSLFEFRDETPIVYIEQDGARGFLDPKDTPRFQDRAARLMKTALGSADSVNFLARIAADYERG